MKLKKRKEENERGGRAKYLKKGPLPEEQERGRESILS